MSTADTYRGRARAAAYLRCYPYDQWRMAVHLHALEEHADRLGHHAPEIFLDNGVSCRAVRPELSLLLARVAVGTIDTVLIPGRWVFSLDDRTADSVMDFVRGCGAEVVELPHHRDLSPSPYPALAGYRVQRTL
ncbi:MULTISPECIES: hypothetical protein [unclassified Streptomyces]|uniref:hypothetical protein n=1 Tax=unclassified Streptomyces TaxID=2593676 RepID=UPI002034017F|nr:MULTISPECIES: hypothetical protein [unclassified Streptomyces]MCM2422993.1 hypothetical protein [Streptomyces sp. RKAG293]MCM2424776.1 hypothetical protein [Streptomyces sp. RKAG337]